MVLVNDLKYLQVGESPPLPFLRWHQHLNYLMYGVGRGPLDSSLNWTHMLVRATVGRNGHSPRWYCVWIEDIESFSPDLHRDMYSHMLGDVDAVLQPEDARMGLDMRTRTYAVLAASAHRLSAMAAEVQPLSLVASCVLCVGIILNLNINGNVQILCTNVQDT